MANPYDVYAAAIARAKTIGGAGYNLDIKGRVYEMDVLPEQNTQRMPYAVMNQVGLQGGINEEDDDRLIELRLPQAISIYVPETSAKAEISTAVRDCFHGLTDILKAFKTDWTLGGVVTQGRFTGHQISAGAVGATYGVVTVTMEFIFYAGAHELGP